MPVWMKAGRNLRYWEHHSRRHGRRPDRFWCLHYTRNKRGQTEGVGWWSQGVTQASCRAFLAELQKNWRTGAGPQTLKELRAAGRAWKEAPGAGRALKEPSEAGQTWKEASEAGQTQENLKTGGRADLTLENFWAETVRPQILPTHSPKNIRQSESRLRAWLGPLLGRPLDSIKTSDLEIQVVKPMLEAGRSPATIEQALRTFSMIWHRAEKLELLGGDCPVIRVKRPKTDNRRVRFLSPAEAARLLAALKARSQDAHDLALLSLFTGLRAGECSALTWADVDFENGLIFVKDTKNQDNRHAFMTAEVRAMLARRRSGRPEVARVFYGRRAEGRCWAATRPFREAVQALGLNEGLTDPRQKVVFHTLRHTFASWLVMKGKPLYTVGKLMGHRHPPMTERYAHLAPEAKRAAVSKLEKFL